MDDFERLLNRDGNSHDSSVREIHLRSHDQDSTPCLGQDRRNDGPRLQIHNSWESTPKSFPVAGGASEWGSMRTRRWDAADAYTPHSTTVETPGTYGLTELEFPEWDEEQVRLDREWYIKGEDDNIKEAEARGALHHENVSHIIPAEISRKSMRKISSREVQYVRLLILIIINSC